MLNTRYSEAFWNPVTLEIKTLRFFETSGFPKSVIQIQILEHLNPLTLYYYLHLDFKLKKFKVTVLWNVTPFVLVRNYMTSRSRKL